MVDNAHIGEVAMDHGAHSDKAVLDHDGAMRTLASIQKARNHAASGRHGPATAILMKALQEVPQLAEELETEVTFSLKAYGEHLAAIGQSKGALWVYKQAIPLLPRPRGLFTNLGALQYSIGDTAASMESFERALALDPDFWPARESLENVKSLAVDRWHYRMLNHAARNKAYSRAICRAISAEASRPRAPDMGITVLDIGTGTGILAVMAARAGATHVFACEVNSVLCDVAREVLVRNGVSDRVTVINKSSAALQAGVDLPRSGVDVIVTELVDSGLLGERIIPVLADARARGLLKEGGQVIPQGAQVYAAVVDSEAVSRRSRLLPGSPAGLSVTTVWPMIEDSYTCEDLDRLEHLMLTSPIPVLEVDFLRDGATLMTPACGDIAWKQQPRRSTLLLPVQRSGLADAVAVWFDLWLDEEKGEGDVVSTRPECCSGRGDASGWDAGIYFASGMPLQEGGEVALEASVGRDRLRLALNGQEALVVQPPAVAEDASKQSRSRASSDADKGPEAVRGPCLVGEMDMARLNDGSFHEAHAHAVARALVAQGVCIKIPRRLTPGVRATSAQLPRSKTETEPSSPPRARVIDLCGTWGLAGLLVAQLERFDNEPAASVLAVTESPQAAAVLNALAAENGLGPDRYLATADRLVDIVSSSRGAIASVKNGNLGKGLGGMAADSATTSRYLSGQQGVGPLTWSVVMASSLVEGSGLLKQGGLEDLELCQRFMSGDGRRGVGASAGLRAGASHSTVFVPGSIAIVCRGLQRASLLSENRVRPECCAGVDVSPVNSFGVANFRELDLSAATGSEKDSYRFARTETPKDKNQAPSGFRREDEAFLTAPVVCYELDLAGVRAGRDGCLQRRTTRLRLERDGTLHAVAYWYRQRLFGGTEIDTGPCTASPVPGAGRASTPSHFRQAAVLLDCPMDVKEGQCIDLVVFCNTSKGAIVQVLGVADPP